MRPHYRKDVKLHGHRNTRHLGNAAWGLLDRLIAYSNDYRLDGFVDLAAASDFATNDAELDLLLAPFPWGAPPMLSRVDGGFRIRDFVGEWNDSAEQIAKRSKVKAKSGRAGGVAKAKQVLSGCSTFATEYSLAKRKHPGAGVGDGEITDPEGVQGGPPVEAPPPEPPTPPDPPSDVRPIATAKRVPGGATPWDLKVRELYCQGIRAGLGGGGFVWPDAFGDQGTLNETIREFARHRDGTAMRGETLEKFVLAMAEDFAAAVTARGASQFYFGFRPKGCARFLAEEQGRERQAAEARAVP